MFGRERISFIRLNSPEQLRRGGEAHRRYGSWENIRRLIAEKEAEANHGGAESKVTDSATNLAPGSG